MAGNPARVSSSNDNIIELDRVRPDPSRRGSSDVMYGVVWPLYGQEDEEGTPVEGPVGLPAPEERKSPLEQIEALLHEAGVIQVKRINERFPPEYCDDCGGPMFADPQGELAVARAAERADLPYTLSTLATRSIEEVAAASAGRTRLMPR